MDRQTHYLNTDLDLVSPVDLTTLGTAFNARKLVTLYLGGSAQEGWQATFEMARHHETPGSTIAAMLKVIEHLDEPALSVWKACTSRTFDVGFRCGYEPKREVSDFSIKLLQRVANVRGKLRVSLYPVENAK